jgi:hypothetical protein
MYSVHDILTRMRETSEFIAPGGGVGSVQCAADSKVVVLDDEARRRALRKRLERQHSRPHNVDTSLGNAS